jgi:hypothetical protein
MRTRLLLTRKSAEPRTGGRGIYVRVDDCGGGRVLEGQEREGDASSGGWSLRRLGCVLGKGISVSRVVTCGCKAAGAFYMAVVGENVRFVG